MMVVDRGASIHEEELSFIFSGYRLLVPLKNTRIFRLNRDTYEPTS